MALRGPGSGAQRPGSAGAPGRAQMGVGKFQEKSDLGRQGRFAGTDLGRFDIVTVAICKERGAEEGA